MTDRSLRYQAEKASILDTGLVALSLIAALATHKVLAYLWPDVFARFDMFWTNAWLYIPLIVIWALIFNGSRLYQEIIGVTKVDLFLHILRLSVISLAVVLSFLYAIRTAMFPRTLLFLQCFYAILFISVRAIYLQPFLLCMSPPQRMLLIGTHGTSGQVFEEWMARIGRADHMEIIGFLMPPSTIPPGETPCHNISECPNQIPQGTTDELERILHNSVVDTVALHLPDMPETTVEHILRLCETEGVEVWVTSDLIQNATTPVSLDRVGNRQILVFNSTTKSFWLLAVKRAMDILISAGALIVLAPFFLLMIILIKLDSPGPAFFTQKRCTLRGRVFNMIKFRTMVDGAEQERDALAGQNEVTGPVFKIKNDPRVTRIGRILRRYSIDEFPQIINVLKGDMSIVGPRPPIPAEVEKYENWQRRRLSMRAGCTCLWQTGGRNKLSFDDWMHLDLKYIDNWSIGLDIRIILKTILVIFRGTGF